MNNKNKIIIITIVGISVVLLGFIIFFLNIQKEKNITYNVTFNSNGGTNIKEQIVNQGDLVKKPADPKKDGYMFIEWTYKGKTYDFSLKVESDLTLNAKWIEIEEDAEKFIIKFETDGGTTISNQVIEKGNKITKPIDPVKDGYIFKGWILNDEFYDFEKTIEENIELKAKWEKIKGNNNNTTNNNSSNNNNTSTNSTTNNNNTTNNDNKNETTNNSTKKWTVRFMCNGNLVTTKEIENNKTVSKPSPPSVPNGMKFKYWSIDGNEFNFNTKITKDYVIDCSYSRLESDTPTVDNDITSAPTNIYFSNENFIGTVNQSIVEVTWDSVKNADSYYIYFSSSENGNYVEKTGVSTTRVRFALENDGIINR